MLPDIVCVYQSDKNAVLVEMPAARSLFYSRAFRTEFGYTLKHIGQKSMPLILT